MNKISKLILETEEFLENLISEDLNNSSEELKYK